MSKTAILPQVRVAPELRQRLESALNDAESLSDFVEAAVRRALDVREAQAEFLARGEAALAQFQATGESHSTDEVLAELRRRTAQRRAELAARPPK
jgi:Arc/MetJ-type ribon-helix-helix transcriptional regulator